MPVIHQIGIAPIITLATFLLYPLLVETRMRKAASARYEYLSDASKEHVTRDQFFDDSYKWRATAWKELIPLLGLLLGLPLGLLPDASTVPGVISYTLLLAAVPVGIANAAAASAGQNYVARGYIAPPDQHSLLRMTNTLRIWSLIIGLLIAAAIALLS